MSKIAWDETGKHLYETGVDRGVVYPAADNGTYPKGYGWNGLTGYTESPSGADETALYADNIKYLSLRSAEEFGATVTAYTYPDEFAKLDGSQSPEGVPGVKIYQQVRNSFGLAVRTLLGNDIKSNDYGYLIHLAYGLTASPSERGYSTVNDSPEAIEFSWELKSVPVSMNGFKPTSVLTIDSTKLEKYQLDAIEEVLYGKDGEISYSEITEGITYDSYNEVAEPTGNPHSNNYYERSGAGTEQDPYTYALSEDTSVDGGKTYYTKTEGSNPHLLGWYELSGSTYVESQDTDAVVDKTYYTKTETDGVDPRLPLPDEVVSIIKNATPPSQVGG